MYGGKKSSSTAFPLGDIDRGIRSPARLLIMKLLFILGGADMVYLKSETGLSWGNLSVQIKNPEEADYVFVEKEFVDNKPHTVVSMSPQGREAFRKYKDRLIEILV